MNFRALSIQLDSPAARLWRLGADVGTSDLVEVEVVAHPDFDERTFKMFATSDWEPTEFMFADPAVDPAKRRTFLVPRGGSNLVTVASWMLFSCRTHEINDVFDFDELQAAQFWIPGLTDDSASFAYAWATAQAL